MNGKLITDLEIVPSSSALALKASCIDIVFVLTS